MDGGHQAAYQDGYQYLRSLIEPLDEAQLALVCPQCPEWSLKDVLAHLMAVQELTATDDRPAWLRSLAALSPEQWNVVDFAVHVGDIEEALGTFASSSMALYALSLERYSELLVAHLEASGVPSVSVVATDAGLTFGDGAAEHRVEGATYELLRVVTGRRTLSEAEESVDWTTTPSDSREVFPIYDWLTESRQHQRAF